MSGITIGEFNIKLLTETLKIEKQKNKDLEMDNEMLRKSLEFYKDLHMKSSVDNFKDDVYVEVKRKKISV